MRRPSPVVIALLFLALCAFFVAWQRAANRRGRMSAPETAMFAVLGPVQRTLNGMSAWGGDVGRAMFARRGLISENKRLQSEVDGLRSQNDRLSTYKTRNEQLGKLLSMPKPA